MPKSFVFKSDKAEAEYKAAYDATLTLFKVEFESSFIETSFGKTHIIACGNKDAEPLILLHGMNVSSTMWYPQIEVLSREFRVFAIDIISDSNKSVPSKRISKKHEYMVWLDEVLDKLEIKSAYFTGHSFGGWMSLSYALHAPDRVKKLALCAPGWFVGMSLIFCLRALLCVLFYSRSRALNFIAWTAVDFSKPDEKFVEQFSLSFRNMKLDKLRIMPTVPKDEELKKLSQPTLLLVGESEVIYEGRKAVDRAKRLIPNIKAELIPQTSHCLTMENAERINEELLNFFMQK